MNGLEKINAHIMRDGEAEVQEILAEAGKRSADMERRQMLLGAKQACIDEAFERAAEKLRNLPREEYIALLARIAAAADTGCEEIVLSAADRESIGADVVAAANAGGASFTLSDETRELGGGLVLKKGKVEANCSFDTQLRQLRQEMASDVARVLFD